MIFEYCKDADAQAFVNCNNCFSSFIFRLYAIRSNVYHVISRNTAANTSPMMAFLKKDTTVKMTSVNAAKVAKKADSENPGTV